MGIFKRAKKIYITEVSVVKGHFDVVSKIVKSCGCVGRQQLFKF